MEKRSRRGSDIKGKKRLIGEMAGRTKCLTIENEKWGQKEYIKESNTGTFKYIIKIKLHMWKLQPNYRRKSLNKICPVCQSGEDTACLEL